MNRRQIRTVTIGCCFVYFVFVFYVTNNVNLAFLHLSGSTTHDPTKNTPAQASQTRKSEASEEHKEKSPFDECVLQRYDPWDAKVMAFADHKFNWFKRCPEYPKPVAELLNRTLTVLKKGFNCSFRCFSWLTEASIRKLPWVEINDTSVETDCEFVHVKCNDANGGNEEELLLSQIVEKKRAETNPRQRPSNQTQYSVYVILLDSISTPQTIRNMPATLTYLEKSLEGVTFPFLNKIALNSYPNAMAFWFNKQIMDNNREAFDLPMKPADPPGLDKTCSNYLNKSEFLIDSYEQMGYTTFFAEDWAMGALVWPNCKGFESQTAVHFNRPYQLLLKSPEGKNMTAYHQANCIELHTEMLKYFGEFMQAYKGKPKFGWLWSAEMSHYYLMQTKHGDMDFRNFLIDNSKELNNAFVFFMGDHGLRFGPYTSTPYGTFEANSAHLTITVPKVLRKNTQLLERLRENADKLQTHFDVHATFKDILMHQPRGGYNNYEPIGSGEERGYSLLRYQPDFPRNCKTLNIPFVYCTCNYTTTNYTTTSPLALELGRYITKHIRDKIAENNITERCHRVKLKWVEEILAYDYVPSGRYQVFVVRIRTVSPNNGTYKALLRRKDPGEIFLSEGTTMSPTASRKPRKGEISLLSPAVERLDSYGKSGACAPYAVSHFCTCKAVPETSW